ncbi:Natural product biosynthesis luciferase-like monooxygenase domain containing protein [Actinobacteria bacterium OK074]|nr:Natural product biosynthesis luciferase-like monooxygenase domain containing protein [Actinobacteria bacterium OK074]
MSDTNDLNGRLDRLSPEHRLLLERRLAQTGRPAPAEPGNSGSPQARRATAKSPAPSLIPLGDGPASGQLPDLSLLFFSGDAAAEEPDGTNPYRLLIESARLADRRGFQAVWLPERHFQRFGGLYPSPSVLAAGIATVTERIGLRSGSVVAPLHDPVRIAEEWAVVDNLSGGRVGLSFATGWHPVDFALVPEAFADRREIMHRTIETVRALWRGERIPRTDGSGGAVEVSTLPRPVQPELPIWVTASSTPATWLRAADLGAGVLCGLISQGPASLAQGISAYRKRWAEHGHPGTGHVSLMLHTFVGDDEDAIRERVREPLTQYLGTFLGQYGSVEEIRRRNPGLDVREDDAAAIVNHAFQRHFDGSSLLGGRDKCLRMLADAAAAGIDEVACLIDFGVGVDETLASLSLLADWRDRHSS